MQEDKLQIKVRTEWWIACSSETRRAWFSLARALSHARTHTSIQLADPSLTHLPGRGCIPASAAQTRPAGTETAGTSWRVCVDICLFLGCVWEACVYGDSWTTPRSSCCSWMLLSVCLGKGREDWRCGSVGLSYLPLAWALPLPGCRGFVRRRLVEWTSWLAGCPGGTVGACEERDNWSVWGSQLAADP